MEVCYGNEICFVVEERDWVAEEQALVGIEVKGDGEERLCVLATKIHTFELDFLPLTEYLFDVCKHPSCTRAVTVWLLLPSVCCNILSATSSRGTSCGRNEMSSIDRSSQNSQWQDEASATKDVCRYARCYPLFALSSSLRPPLRPRSCRNSPSSPAHAMVPKRAGSRVRYTLWDFQR